jgi:hypothetical protein
MQKLHLKETGLQSEVMAQRGGRADAQSLVRKLQCDIAELADAIQDPKLLKEKVRVVCLGELHRLPPKCSMFQLTKLCLHVAYTLHLCMSHTQSANYWQKLFFFSDNTTPVILWCVFRSRRYTSSNVWTVMASLAALPSAPWASQVRLQSGSLQFTHVKRAVCQIRLHQQQPQILGC